MDEPIISTSYSVDNDRRWQRTVDRALKELGDLRNPFKLIASDFYKSEQAIFKLKGPGQYPDFKNEESRQAKERVCGFEYPLLVRSGKLMRSMTQPGAEGSILDIKATYMIIATDVKSKKGKNYGTFHQSDAPRKVIPQRKFLFIGPEAKQFATSEQMGRLSRWTQTMHKYVEKKLKPVGKTK